MIGLINYIHKVYLWVDGESSKWENKNYKDLQTGQ